LVKEKKKAILKSAEYLFSTKGFHETTVADIAKESGVHEASIYSYFNNKRNILFSIYGGYLQNAIETLREHFQGMKEPGPKLRKTIWHYLADMQNNPNYAKILIMAQRENPEFYVSDHVKYLKQYSNLIIKVIIAGQKEGFFRADINPRLVRNMGMGASVFTAIDSVVHNRAYDPNKTSDLIYQLVINATAAEVQAVENTQTIQKGDRAEFRKTQIINNAIRVFSRKGFSNATISEVAKQANLGDATLYEYFDNKEAILLSSAEVFLKQLDSDDAIPFDGLMGPEKTLRKLIWRYLWQLYTFEDFSRVLILELFRNIKFYYSPAYRYLEDFFEKIVEAIQKGQREGIFIKEAPIPTYLHMISGTFDQFLLSQYLLNRAPVGLAELNTVVDLLVRAIKVREYP
jgi:TetR/AcrR family fatty acid metabolism transcriptional regulator